MSILIMITNIVEHSLGTRHQATPIHLEMSRGLCNAMTGPHLRAEELIPLLLGVV